MNYLYSPILNNYQSDHQICEIVTAIEIIGVYLGTILLQLYDTVKQITNLNVAKLPIHDAVSSLFFC